METALLFAALMLLLLPVLDRILTGMTFLSVLLRELEKENWKRVMGGLVGRIWHCRERLVSQRPFIGLTINIELR